MAHWRFDDVGKIEASPFTFFSKTKQKKPSLLDLKRRKISRSHARAHSKQSFENEIYARMWILLNERERERERRRERKRRRERDGRTDKGREKGTDIGREREEPT